MNRHVRQVLQLQSSELHRNPLADEPVVITEDEELGKVAGKWTPEYLRKTSNATVLEAMELLLSETGCEHGLSDASIPLQFPELLADLKSSRVILTAIAQRPVTSYLSLSGRGRRAILQRNDFSRCVLAQLSGRRRLTLFPPALVSAEQIACDLCPGNALYVPRNWYFIAETIDVSIAARLQWSVI